MSETLFLKTQQFIHVMKLIQKICEQNNIDQTHGLSHAIEIAIHVKKALNAFQQNQKLCQQEQQNVILAALLHDIDDHKYFKTQNYQNARSILDKVLHTQQRKQKILRMVDLVSFTKNGNQIYEKDPPYYYYTRYADRVEAIGLIGIYRTFLYSQRLGTPFYTQLSPKPSTRQQIYEIMQNKNHQYMQRVGKSICVIDHLFEKPLHIKLPVDVQNSYIDKLYSQGHQYMIDFILYHSKTGYINAQNDLIQRVDNWMKQKPNKEEINDLLKLVSLIQNEN